jgi:hypothetical protein
VLSTTAKEIKGKLDEYIEFINELAVVCMMLDPRFKLNGVKSAKCKEYTATFEKYYKLYERDQESQDCISSFQTNSSPDPSRKSVYF